MTDSFGARQRLRSGEIGDITSLRAYRMAGVSGNAYCKPNDGSLSDVAPSLLTLMGLEKPGEMTGHSLVELD